MNKQQEFRKQTEEAKLEAFSLMCIKVAELEKENAELKSGCGMCYRKDKEQLTKAKEIIRTFLGFAEAFGYSPSMDKFITEAEQFLKGESTTSNECHDCAKFDEMPNGSRCKTCDNGSHFQKKEEA